MRSGDLTRKLCEQAGEPVPNMDAKTGIFYGVISGQEAPDWFWEEAVPEYPAMDTEECGGCGDIDCEPCMEAEQAEPISYVIDTPTFKAEVDCNSNIIMVYFSERIVECRECSPCYPCAGDLSAIEKDGGTMAYAFPLEEATMRPEPESGPSNDAWALAKTDDELQEVDRQLRERGE